jgi:hypothetical protein
MYIQNQSVSKLFVSPHAVRVPVLHQPANANFQLVGSVGHPNPVGRHTTQPRPIRGKSNIQIAGKILGPGRTSGPVGAGKSNIQLGGRIAGPAAAARGTFLRSVSRIGSGLFGAGVQR